MVAQAALKLKNLSRFSHRGGATTPSCLPLSLALYLLSRGGLQSPLSPRLCVLEAIKHSQLIRKRVVGLGTIIMINKGRGKEVETDFSVFRNCSSIFFLETIILTMHFPPKSP